MAKTFQILTLNKISAQGLQRLPAARYVVGTEIAEPDAILVRSHHMLDMHIPASVKAIARAGAGTNNVPVKKMSERGVPVFNAAGRRCSPCAEILFNVSIWNVLAMFFSELVHEVDQSLHAFQRHRIVNRGTHTAHRTVSLELQQSARIGLFDEIAIQS